MAAFAMRGTIWADTPQAMTCISRSACALRQHGRKAAPRIALALIDLASETILWTQECEGDWNALMSQRDPELITLILRCVERVWSETERKMNALKQEDDGPEQLRSAIQDMFELGAQDLDHAALELRKLLPGKFGAIAGAWLAFLSTFRVGQRFVRDDGPLHEEARFLITRALERDPDNALIKALAGHVHSYLLGNQMKAVELFEQSLRLNPTRALAWDLYSVLHAYMGLPDAGLKAAQFGRHLGALSPYRYYFDTSCLIAASMAGQHEIAVEYGESVLRERPEFNSVLRFLTRATAIWARRKKPRPRAFGCWRSNRNSRSSRCATPAIPASTRPRENISFRA